MSTPHIEALRSRAKTGLLSAAENNLERSFSFWRGQLALLTGLERGVALAMAGKDQLSGYEAPTHLQAAWAALPEGAEKLTLTEVQQILTAQGVQVTLKPIANGNVNARQQLEHSEVAIVNLHDEHAPAAVDGNDGARVLHGSGSCGDVSANVAQQGGAA